jgi:hypothetical protein
MVIPEERDGRLEASQHQDAEDKGPNSRKGGVPEMPGQQTVSL